MVNCVPSPDGASLTPKEVDAAAQRLAELLDMLHKGDLSVVPDIQRNQYLIADHSPSTNGDARLQGRFSKVQVEG